MDRQEAARWEQEYVSLLKIAQDNLRPEWECGEVLVVKTTKGRIHVVQIPNVADHTVREPLENQCIQMLSEENDTEVFVCFATVDGEHPEIPSWNFRSRLMELNEENLQTVTFLWGGGNKIIVKPFSKLLPPNYTIKKGTSL